MTPNQPFLASQRDVLLLLSRILLVILFVMFGWKKIVDFSGTIAFMGSEGAPAPIISAAIAVVMELFVGIALLIGFQTRPLALLLALYTIGTALIGMKSADHVEENAVVTGVKPLAAVDFARLFSPA